MIFDDRNNFTKNDVIKSYSYLSHRQHGFTELLAIHKDYKPGRQNFKLNLENKRLPKVWYTKNINHVLWFVSKYHKDHTCCYGVNPRPGILINQKGRIRSAKEDDIKILNNFYFDIDCKKPKSELTDEYFAEVQFFIAGTECFFEDRGINPPGIAFSGRGFHLLFTPIPIQVDKHPDIKQKIIQFKIDYEQYCKDCLEKLNLKIDSTLDLRRMVKIYGTSKPNVYRPSLFYDMERVEDPALTKYLINIEVDNDSPAKSVVYISSGLPQNFQRILENNQLIQKIWDGTGKTQGDVSNSGYDFSLVKLCLKNHITDINDLSTILALRPNGAFQKSGKDETYIKRTVSKAIMSC